MKRTDKVEIDDLISDISRPSSKKENAENHCAKGGSMVGMFVDCREYPSEMNCTVAISVDTREELVGAAVQHAVAVHGHQDSPHEELATLAVV
jgi:hypothetical protein